MFEFEKPARCGRRASNAGRPEHKRNARAWVERAALVIGIALLAIYGLIRIESIVGSRAALYRFAALNSSTAAVQEEGGERKESGPPEELHSSKVDYSLWGDNRIAAYLEGFAEPTGAPLALLRIPKINLQVAVLDGTDDLTLNQAVGRIARTARPGEPGNIGIAGHRDGFFRGLKEVGIGDEIELQTPKGTDAYLVDEIEIVAPQDVEVLQPRSVRSLTLVTCYPFYFIGSAPQRYIVKASLRGEAQNELRR